MINNPDEVMKELVKLNKQGTTIMDHFRRKAATDIFKTMVPLKTAECRA